MHTHTQTPLQKSKKRESNIQQKSSFNDLSPPFPHKKTMWFKLWAVRRTHRGIKLLQEAGWRFSAWGRLCSRLGSRPGPLQVHRACCKVQVAELHGGWSGTWVLAPSEIQGQMQLDSGNTQIKPQLCGFCLEVSTCTSLRKALHCDNQATATWWQSLKNWDYVQCLQTKVSF